MSSTVISPQALIRLISAASLCNATHQPTTFASAEETLLQANDLADRGSRCYGQDGYIYMPALRQRQLPGGTNLKDSFSLSDFVVAVLLYFILFALLAHCYSFYSFVALLAEFFLFQIPAYLHCKNFLIIITTIIFFINILPYYPIKI